MITGPTANIVNYNIVNSSGVKIGATTTYVCNVNQYSGSPGRTSPKQKSSPMSEDVESLWRENRPITLDDMFVIKTHLGVGWKDFFKCLGYSDGQLEQLDEAHHTKGLDEVIPIKLIRIRLLFGLIIWIFHSYKLRIEFLKIIVKFRSDWDAISFHRSQLRNSRRQC